MHKDNREIGEICPFSNFSYLLRLLCCFLGHRETTDNWQMIQEQVYQLKEVASNFIQENKKYIYAGAPAHHVRSSSSFSLALSSLFSLSITTPAPKQRNRQRTPLHSTTHICTHQNKRHDYLPLPSPVFFILQRKNIKKHPRLTPK